MQSSLPNKYTKTDGGGTFSMGLKRVIVVLFIYLKN